MSVVLKLIVNYINQIVLAQSSAKFLIGFANNDHVVNISQIFLHIQPICPLAQDDSRMRYKGYDIISNNLLSSEVMFFIE